MKFSTKEDAEIPIEELFSLLSDFDSFERIAMRHGIEITRVDETPHPIEGMRWAARGQLRGKIRDVDVVLTRYDSPSEMMFMASSNGIHATFLTELVALSRNRTRARFELDIKPKTLSARLVLQSARLARSTLTKRYKTRVANYVEDLEDRFLRGARA